MSLYGLRTVAHISASREPETGLTHTAKAPDPLRFQGFAMTCLLCVRHVTSLPDEPEGSIRPRPVLNPHHQLPPGCFLSYQRPPDASLSQLVWIGFVWTQLRFGFARPAILPGRRWEVNESNRLRS